MSNGLYIGQVMHERFFPFKYRFKYHIFSLKIDVDTVEAATSKLKILSFNRFNILSLHNKDYGARNDKSWRQWFDDLMSKQGLTTPVDKIELVCMPRYLGFAFNPLAMWYGYDSANNLVAIVAEVSNTFGQWHHYVLSDKGQDLGKRVYAEADKDFHVSPFMNMNCKYRFRLFKPDEHYQIGIYETENKKPLLNAVQVGVGQELSNANLAKATLKMPFNTLKVVVMIHWWALKIYFKGGKFHKTPKHLKNIKHSCTEMKLC